MSSEADRIFVLEEALVAAVSLAEFLYGCLETPGYSHAYPRMSRAELDKLHAIAPKRLCCGHSKTVEGCESCAERVALFARRAEIEARA